MEEEETKKPSSTTATSKNPNTFANWILSIIISAVFHKIVIMPIWSF